MLPLTNLNRALITSVHDEITKQLEDQTLVLQRVGSGYCLANRAGMVYCIANNEVQLKNPVKRYRTLAQELYNELPDSIKALAEEKISNRKAEVNNTATKLYVKPEQASILSGKETLPYYGEPGQIGETPDQMTTIASAESQEVLYVPLRGYFSGLDLIDIGNSNFKRKNKELFKYMTDSALKNEACDAAGVAKGEGARYVYTVSNVVFHMTLPRLLMIAENKKSLEPLIREFEVGSDTEKKEIALNIATQCVEDWEKHSEMRRSNKALYDKTVNAVKAEEVADKSSEETVSSSAVAVRESGAVATLETRIKLAQAVSRVHDFRGDEASIRGQLSDMTLNMAPAFDGHNSANMPEACARQLAAFEQLKAESSSAMFKQKEKAAEDSKKVILDSLKTLIESGGLVDMKTGDLYIPKGVHDNPKDCKAFQTYALDLVCHYRDALLKNGNKEDSFIGTTINGSSLENISMLLFQIQKLIDRNSKHL